MCIGASGDSAARLMRSDLLSLAKALTRADGTAMTSPIPVGGAGNQCHKARAHHRLRCG
jgi:hypothetical protein